MIFVKILLILFFNILNKSDVRSLNFSCKAARGSKSIKVLSGTWVDDFCSVGSFTFIGKNVSISKSKIGRYCSIANNVSIGQGEHDLDEISTSSLFYDCPYEKLTSEDCVIHDDVWIGVDAIILRGVTVGFGSVIAANAVVTKDVPPFSIVAGVPAKIIKYRKNPIQINHILKSKWWLSDIGDAKKIINRVEKEMI